IGLRVLAVIRPSPLLVLPNAGVAETIERNRGRPGGSIGGKPFNKQGFFDEDFQLERRPGVRRIVALSDSFGFGVVHYEDNFLTVLERLLQAERPTEVLNFSVPAVGPAHYLFLYQLEAQRYKPDLVLVCVFIGNDIERRHRPRSLLHANSVFSIAVLKRLMAFGSH